MKKSAFAFLLMVIIVLIGVYGCMNDSGKKSNQYDQEYVEHMKNYIQEKYSITVESIECILPKSGFNTALLENILVVRDANGVIANVKAKLGAPYTFYDDYVQACTAAAIQDELSMDSLSIKAKIYVVIKEADLNNIDTSAENIVSLSFISMIDEEPTESILEELFGIYNKLQDKKYENIYYLVGFTDGSEEFKMAVENYTVYGQSEWDDYKGKVYSEIFITENGLSFEKFKTNVKKLG